MANERILLVAKASQLGIEGYRKMSEDELRAAIKSAETGSKPTKGKTVSKGKTSTNGTASKSKGKTVVQKATGGTAKKTAKGKTTPAKGKSTPAKGKASSAKTVKASPAKSKAKKTAPAKGKASQGAQAKRTPARGSKSATGAARIDAKSIDWKAESNVGKTGKRADVMDMLRKFKGDKTKVFAALQGNAKRYYPGKSKHEAERTLVWLIGRVAFDFVMATGQHTPGKRAEYGTSQAEQDIRRRARREEARKAAEKAARATKRSGGTKSKGKSAKAAGGRRRASKGKR